MRFKILLIWFVLLFFFISCGSSVSKDAKSEDLNSSETIIDNISENNMSEENNLTKEPFVENNTTKDNNLTEDTETIEVESVDMNYTNEELTLSAYDRYITPSPSAFSAKIVSLFFKVEQPIENGIAIIKDNQAFSFELNWQNPAYAKNVNFYFSHGRQSSIQYISGAIPHNSESYSGTCKVFENYRFKCNGVSLDESKYYIGKTKPIRSSFIMAVCDRSTQDPNRICDFIRIPIEFRE